MKIIGLIGSYRKNGNIDTAVRKVLEGAMDQGAEVEAIYLKDHEIKDCNGCEACKKHLSVLFKMICKKYIQK